MPTYTGFKFKGTGTDPEDAEQTCALNAADAANPVLTIAATAIPVLLEDEFLAMLDAVDAEDTTDGVDPEVLRLGRGTPQATSFGVEFDDSDPANVKRYIKPPNQTRWSMSKARDFHVGCAVVRGGLGI